jgi:hypothetical protein
LAKTKLPDPLSRRHLLGGEMDAAKAKELAQLYLDAGREIEAIEFFAKAGDREALVAQQEIAVGRGDVFLMKAASAGLEEEPSAARWQALADAAVAGGRQRDADSALRLATVED